MSNWLSLIRHPVRPVSDLLDIDFDSFRRARGYLSNQRWRMIAAGFFAVVSALSFVALVVVVGELGELLFTPRHTLNPALTPVTAQNHRYASLRAGVYERIGEVPRNLTCLGILLAATIALAGIRSLSNYAQTRLISRTVTDATQRMRRAIYNQAYRLGTTEVSGIGVAPAINVFTRETDAVRDGLVAWLDSVVREPVLILLLLAIALMAHWSLALLFLLCAAVGVYLARRQILAARASAAAATRTAAEKLALLQESLFLIRLTRGYLMENAAATRFERNLAQFTQSELRQLNSTAAVKPLIQFVGVLCITLVVGLASFNLLVDSMSPSSTVVLYASLISLYWPVRTLFERVRTVKLASESASAVFAFIEQHTRLTQVADASFLAPLNKTLQFVNVRVQESGQPPVLDGVSLSIQASTRTAIMGMDERAKRALVYLIPRFLDPAEGQVLMDGQDIRFVTLESLRAQVALVLQSEFVFTGTVADNIGCGEPSYGLPHIVDAAKIAHAHQFIQRLPAGYDTLIGDQGESLSIGQQFRIALARAILRDPTVVIIEEPTVHLDDDTKSLLDDTLTRFCPGRTVIFLPHRLSTIRACDSIVILYDGKIATTGNHRDLTLASELYRHLQYTEFNVFAAG
jgi:ATP-binding cassette subfamily B protein